MMNLNRQHTSPLDVPRTLRRDVQRNLTSLPAGKVVPVAAVGLLREDAMRSGMMRMSFEMQETAEILMNAVYVDVKAYLVPWLAFERFAGSRDIFDRSYNGVSPFADEEVISFFAQHAMGAHGSKELYKYLGKHAKAATNVNMMYAEAYNAIWNFRAQNRSPNIDKRDADDTTLAPAFWRHSNFAHIVPDFDAAVMEGAVALNYVGGLTGTAPVVGDGTDILFNSTAGTGGKLRLNASGTNSARLVIDPNPSTNGDARWQSSGLEADLSEFLGELASQGFTVSLANIDLAKKTQAFAQLRERYSEHSEEWVIDMLMSGLSIPDQALKQPILLGERSNVFGMNKRYSTDADALTASAVNGMSMVDMNIRVPRLATGGVVMVTAEVTPEQLFERGKDPFFHLGSVEELPDFLRDDLDPQKVEVVPNDYVDVDHDTPDGTFGFAPLGYKWNRVSYNIGGRFYRPAVDASFDEDRQRLWAVETENPVLSEDFYLCTTMHTKVFLDTIEDPFDAVCVADFVIEGNTVFGGVLVEAMANYEAVMAKAPTDRIEKE